MNRGYPWTPQPTATASETTLRHAPKNHRVRPSTGATEGDRDRPERQGQTENGHRDSEKAERQRKRQENVEGPNARVRDRRQHREKDRRVERMTDKKRNSGTKRDETERKMDRQRHPGQRHRDKGGDGQREG